MRKIEDAIGVGCLFGLLSLPLSIWAEVPGLLPMLITFFMGAVFQFMRSREYETQMARDELAWSMVSKNVGRECGWDQREANRSETFDIDAYRKKMVKR